MMSVQAHALLARPSCGSRSGIAGTAPLARERRVRPLPIGVTCGHQRQAASRLRPETVQAVRLVLDAQFAGVAQRRERLFAVGHHRDWRAPAAVLFEPESVCGHHPPRREARERVAPTLSARTQGGGGLGTDFDCDGGLIAGTVSAKWVKGTGGPAGDECYNLVAHALRADGFDASEDGTGRGTPLVPFAFDTTQITSPISRANPQPGDPCHTLSKGMYAPAIAFSSKDHGADACDDLAPTMRAMNHTSSHANAGGQLAIAQTQSVRRLTPRECERLQGFPDDYTQIQYRGKNAADGPRYKALGNSMAVPVMRWILSRIEQVEAAA